MNDALVTVLAVVAAPLSIAVGVALAFVRCTRRAEMRTVPRQDILRELERDLRD